MKSLYTYVNPRLPGRCLRGRWLSVESVEEKINNARVYVGPVFRKVFSAPKKPTKKDLRTQDDDDFSEKQTTARANVVTLLNKWEFHAMTSISGICKNPLTYYMLWAQKSVGVTNQREAAAKAEGRVYLGDTTLSKLASWQGARIRTMMCANLFFELNLDSPGADPFAEVRDLVPDAHHHEALRLIVSLSLVMIASWDFRFTSRLCSFPLSLLVFVHKPADEPCEDRRKLAAYLLDTQVCCLKSASLGTDAAVKVRSHFARHLNVVRDTGGCVPPKLFLFILMIRSRLTHDTQDLEGCNSLLQIMGKIAPNLRHAMANDRLKIKKGDPLRVQDAIDLHGFVQAHQRTCEYMERFALVDTAETPEEVTTFNCEHQHPEGWTLAARLQLGMWKIAEVDVAVVFTFDTHTDGRDMDGFVLCWSYFRAFHVAFGKIITELTNPPPLFSHYEKPFFELIEPGVVKTLTDVIVALPADRLRREEVEVVSYAAKWFQLSPPIAFLSDRKVLCMKPAAPQRRRAPAEAAGPAPEDVGREGAEPSPLEDEATDIEEWLRRVMGMDGGQDGDELQDLAEPERIEVEDEHADVVTHAPN